MPSLRLFKKRASLPPGRGGDRKAGDHPEVMKLTYTAPPPEKQATLAGDQEQVSDGPDGVSGSTIQESSGHATSSDEALFTQPFATGPGQPSRTEDDRTSWRFGRYGSKRDPFRLFRSRSTQFRKSTDDGDGIEGGGGSGSDNNYHDSGDKTTRLSWQAPRSTSPTPLPEPQARARAQTPPWGRPEFETVEESISAVNAEAVGGIRGWEQEQEQGQEQGHEQEQERPWQWQNHHHHQQQQQQSSPQYQHPHQQQNQQQPPPPQQHKKHRPDSTSETTTISVDTSNSLSWKLQSLKRLPSLSLKRRLSRREKPNPPQVIVTSATVVSSV